MEEIDRKIVSLLTRNGRMSFTELGRQAGLSVSAVHQRVRRLEQRGLITGYAANESLMRASVRDVLGDRRYELFFDRLLTAFFGEEDATQEA